MLNTTRDFDKMYKCSDLLPDPGPEVVKGILDDYLVLLASHQRLLGIMAHVIIALYESDKATDYQHYVVGNAEKVLAKANELGGKGYV